MGLEPKKAESTWLRLGNELRHWKSSLRTSRHGECFPLWIWRIEALAGALEPSAFSDLGEQQASSQNLRKEPPDDRGAITIGIFGKRK
jgi:hypothetical protein